MNHARRTFFHNVRGHGMIGHIVVTESTLHVMMGMHHMVFHVMVHNKQETERALFSFGTKAEMLFPEPATQRGATGAGFNHIRAVRIEVQVDGQLGALKLETIRAPMIGRRVRAKEQVIFAVRGLHGQMNSGT